MRWQCMPSAGPMLAEAKGATAGTVITSNKKLAVRRCNLPKMSKDILKLFYVRFSNTLVF